MEIRFNLTGADRKALVSAVSEIIGCEAVYQRAPTFAYVVNSYTIDKDGTLISDERTDAGEVHSLLTKLTERGFLYEDMIPTEDAPDLTNEVIPDRLSIEVPLEGFTDTALLNLERLVESKTELICKSLGTDNIPIEKAEDRLIFPWFSAEADCVQVTAYTQFIHALCEMAKTQKRVTSREKPVDSEKYAFRCFLLRLGFIGPEFGSARKILLANLSGDGSFKDGKREKSDPNTAQNRAKSLPKSRANLHN